MNEIIKAMRERRSVRTFKPDMPDRETIDEIIGAGLFAPSGMDRQDVKIIAVTDKELRETLAKDNAAIGGRTDGGDPFYGAPVVLLVIADKNVPTHVYDGCMVMANLLLASFAEGLGSVWIHRAKEELEMPFYKELLKSLNIEGDWEGIGHCALGYVSGAYPEAKPRRADRVYHI